VCLTVVLAACGGSSGTTGQSKQPFKIGSIWSLTGAAAAANVIGYHETQMIVDDINSNGGLNGRRIDVTYEDDQSNPSQGVTAAKLLINNVGVHVIVGPGYTPVALSVSSIAESSNTVLFTPGSIAPQLTNPLQKYIFAANPTTAVVGPDVINLMTSMGFHNPGMIAESDSFGDLAVQATTNALSAKGLKIGSQASIGATAIDATAQVAKMQADGVDVVVGGVDTLGAMTAVLKAMYQQKVTFPYISFVIFGGIDQVLAQYPVEAYAATPTACPLTSSCAASFVSEYQARYPSDSSILPAAGLEYAAMQAFFQALKQAKSDSADDVVQALETAPAYSNSLLPGPFQWTATSHLGSHLVAFEGFKAGKLYFFGNVINQNHLGS
jgi:branched-chain amino acid transport system substrate-binding protein